MAALRTEEARPGAERARERQRFDRGAQRSERVFQFVRDVGGETLDRLDAAVERVGHLAKRAGELADLVAPVGEVGNLPAPVPEGLNTY